MHSCLVKGCVKSYILPVPRVDNVGVVDNIELLVGVGLLIPFLISSLSLFWSKIQGNLGPVY